MAQTFKGVPLEGEVVLSSTSGHSEVAVVPQGLVYISEYSSAEKKPIGMRMVSMLYYMYQEKITHPVKKMRSPLIAEKAVDEVNIIKQLNTTPLGEYLLMKLNQVNAKGGQFLVFPTKPTATPKESMLDVATTMMIVDHSKEEQKGEQFYWIVPSTRQPLLVYMTEKRYKRRLARQEWVKQEAHKYGKYNPHMKSLGIIYGPETRPNRKKVLPSQYLKEKQIIDNLKQSSFLLGQRLLKVIPLDADRMYLEDLVEHLEKQKKLLIDYLELEVEEQYILEHEGEYHPYVVKRVEEKMNWINNKRSEMKLAKESHLLVMFIEDVIEDKVNTASYLGGGDKYELLEAYLFYTSEGYSELIPPAMGLTEMEKSPFHLERLKELKLHKGDPTILNEEGDLRLLRGLHSVQQGLLELYEKDLKEAYYGPLHAMSFEDKLVRDRRRVLAEENIGSQAELDARLGLELLRLLSTGEQVMIPVRPGSVPIKTNFKNYKCGKLLESRSEDILKRVLFVERRRSLEMTEEEISKLTTRLQNLQTTPVGSFKVLPHLYEYGNAMVMRGLLPENFINLPEDKVFLYPTEEQMVYQSYRKGRGRGSRKNMVSVYQSDFRMMTLAELERERLLDKCKKEGDEFCVGVNQEGYHVFLGISRVKTYPDGITRVVQVYKKETIRKENDRSHIVDRVLEEDKHAQDVIDKHHQSYKDKQFKRLKRMPNVDVMDKKVEIETHELKERAKALFQDKKLDANIVNPKETRVPGTSSFMVEQERQKEEWNNAVVEERWSRKKGDGLTQFITEEYVDSLNINEKQLILTSSKTHKHEISQGKTLYEVSTENQLSSAELLELKVRGKFRGEQLGYAKPKVFINEDRVSDPIAQSMIRYAQRALHKKQKGTGYMLEIGTALPEGVELVRQRELRKLKNRVLGQRKREMLSVTPLVGHYLNALPKHVVQSKMHIDHTYEGSVPSVYMTETAKFLMEKRSELDGRQISLDEAVVRRENNVLYELGRRALNGDKEAFNDFFTAQRMRSARYHVDTGYKHLVDKTLPYTPADWFTPELYEGDRKDYTVRGVPQLYRKVSAKPKKQWPLTFKQEPTTREMNLRESSKELVKVSHHPVKAEIYHSVEHDVMDMDVYRNSMTYVELELLLYKLKGPHAIGLEGEADYMFLMDTASMSGQDLERTPLMVYENDLEKRLMTKRSLYVGLRLSRRSSTTGRLKPGSPLAGVPDIFENILLMFAVSQVSSAVGTSLLNLENGARWYNKVGLIMQVLRHGREGKGLGDLLPDYRSRREHNLLGMTMRPLTILKANGKRLKGSRGSVKLDKDVYNVSDLYIVKKSSSVERNSLPPLLSNTALMTGEDSMLEAIFMKMEDQDVLEYKASLAKVRAHPRAKTNARYAHHLTKMHFFELMLKDLPTTEEDLEDSILREDDVVIRGMLLEEKEKTLSKAQKEELALYRQLVRKEMEERDELEDEDEDEDELEDDEDLDLEDEDEGDELDEEDDLEDELEDDDDDEEPLTQRMQDEEDEEAAKLYVEEATAQKPRRVFRRETEKRAIERLEQAKKMEKYYLRIKESHILHSHSPAYLYSDKELRERLEEMDLLGDYEEGSSRYDLYEDDDLIGGKDLKGLQILRETILPDILGFMSGGYRGRSISGSPLKRTAEARGMNLMGDHPHLGVYKRFPINTLGFRKAQLEDMFMSLNQEERRWLKVQEEQDRDTMNLLRDRASLRDGMKKRHIVLGYFKRYRKMLVKRIKHNEMMQIMKSYLTYKDEESHLMMLVYYGVSKHSYSQEKLEKSLGQDQRGVSYYYSVSQLVDSSEDHHGRSHISERTYIIDLMRNDGKQRRVGRGGIRAYSNEHDVVHVPYGMVTYHGRDRGDDALEHSYRLFDKSKQKSLLELDREHHHSSNGVRDGLKEVDTTTDLASKYQMTPVTSMNTDGLDENETDLSRKVEEKYSHGMLQGDVLAVYHKFVMLDHVQQSQRTRGLLVQPYTVKLIHGQGYYGGKLIPLGRRDIQDRLLDREMTKERLNDLNYYRRNLDTEGLTNLDESPVGMEKAMQGMVRLSVGANIVSESMYLSQMVNIKVYGEPTSKYTRVQSDGKDENLNLADYLIKYGDSVSKLTSQDYVEVTSILLRDVELDEMLVDRAYVPKYMLEDRVETMRSFYKISHLIADGGVLNNVYNEVLIFVYADLHRTGDVFASQRGLPDPHGGYRLKGGDRFDLRLTLKSRLVDMERGISVEDLKGGEGLPTLLKKLEQASLAELIPKYSFRKPRNLAKHLVHSKMLGGPLHIQHNTYYNERMRLQQLPAKLGGAVLVGELSQAFTHLYLRMYQELFLKKRYAFYYSFKIILFAFSAQIMKPKYDMRRETRLEMNMLGWLYKNELLTKAELSKAVSVRNTLLRFLMMCRYAMADSVRRHKAKERSARMINGYVTAEQRRQYIQREDALPQMGWSTKPVQLDIDNEELVQIFKLTKDRARPAHVMKVVHRSNAGLKNVAGFNRDNPRFGYFDGGLYDILDRNLDMEGPFTLEVKGHRISQTREHLGNDTKMMYVVSRRSEALKTVRKDSGKVKLQVHTRLETMDLVRYEGVAETTEQFPVYVRTFLIQSDGTDQVYLPLEETLYNGTRTILTEMLEGLRIAPRMQVWFKSHELNLLKKLNFDHGVRLSYAQKNGYIIPLDGEQLSLQDSPNYLRRTLEEDHYEEMNPEVREYHLNLRSFLDTKTMRREYDKRLDEYKRGAVVKARKNLSKFRKFMAYMKEKSLLDAPDHLLTMNRSFDYPEFDTAVGKRKVNKAIVRQEDSYNTLKKVAQTEWVAGTSNYKSEDSTAQRAVNMRASGTPRNPDLRYVQEASKDVNDARTSARVTLRQLRTAGQRLESTEIKQTYKQMKDVLSNMKLNARESRLKSSDLMMKELNSMITNQTETLKEGAGYWRNKMVRPNQREAPKDKPLSTTYSEEPKLKRDSGNNASSINTDKKKLPSSKKS